MVRHPEQPHVDGASGARRAHRRPGRARTVLGVVGVAAILGGGSFLITEMMTDDADRVVGGTDALAPPGPGGATVPTVGPVPGPSPDTGMTSSPPAAAPSASATATSSAAPKTVAERIAAARSAAAKARNQVRRPLPPQNGNEVATAAEMTVTESGSLKRERATLRVVSARQDLAGQHELSWAADTGEPVGDASCTQNFHFSAGAPPVQKPTLLLCWRTSATKSVYTVAVSIDGRPSERASVAAIDRRWTQMG